ncbi:MAG TPA: serine protease [Ktedonobacteraceae bacterium]|nr:serine protease [Ktedonobacteraceae bacterium]
MNSNWLTQGVSPDGFVWHGPVRPETRKAIVDVEQKLKKIWYLERAVEVSRLIGRVLFPDGKHFATCFLVAPQLILTNHHVFGTPETTTGVRIQFNYREQYDGSLAETDEYQCDPTTFITDEVLDFTLVGLTQPVKSSYLRLRHGDKPVRESHLAIIQHPNGYPLQVAMRDNSLVYDDANTIEYLTNTDYGSSGAPVFNDNWNVIALHSQRVKDPNSDTWYRNRGTKIEAILRIHSKDVNLLLPAR